MTKTETLIAVVDDDASVRKSIGRLLRSAGFSVAIFTSAEEFLQAIDTCAPNCLVLDVHMPNMDGLALQGLLASRDDKVPIVFITADDDENTRERALSSSAVEFLVKPFDDSRLIEAIEKALNRQC